MLPLARLVAAAALLAPAAGWAAGDDVTGVTVELNGHTLQTLPTWLAVTDPATDGAAAADFQIAAPQGVGDLAVTFYFRETNGSVLSVDWTGPVSTVPLSANLCEGVNLPNQRTILIPRDTIGPFGTLSVRSADIGQPLDRVRFEWTIPVSLASTPGALVPGLLRADGSVLTADDVDGQPVFPEEDRWVGRTVTAPLSAVPERVEGGTAYCVDIAESPKWARLDLQVSGLPLDGSVRVWVNGSLTCLAAPAVPDLNDPGLITDGDGRAAYAGWRRATVFLPPGTVVGGDNTFQFTPEDRLNPAAPLAVKDVTLQIRFHDSPPEGSRLVPPSPTLR